MSRFTESVLGEIDDGRVNAETVQGPFAGKRELALPDVLIRPEARTFIRAIRIPLPSRVDDPASLR